MSIKVGHIVRYEDESGVSGTGIVAEWVEYSDGEVVVHWLSHTPSTNHYRNLKQVESIHGHGGKTSMVTIWEEPKLETPATAEENGESSPDAEAAIDLSGPALMDEVLEKEEDSKRAARKKAPPKKKPE